MILNGSFTDEEKKHIKSIIEEKKSSFEKDNEAVFRGIVNISVVKDDNVYIINRLENIF